MHKGFSFLEPLWYHTHCMHTWTNWYQRIEGAVVFLAALYFYAASLYSLVWFALLLFSFDVNMAGYLVNNKMGAHIYNIGHSFSLPVALLLIGVSIQASLVIALALIWFAHIGMDRALGYGLKFEAGFTDTHLGKIGK